MTSIASAPAKVILFGEHFVVYDVKAVLCSIDKRVKVTTTPIDENKIEDYSLNKDQSNIKNHFEKIDENKKSELLNYDIDLNEEIDEFSFCSCI